MRTQSAAEVKEWMRLNYDVAVNTLVPALAQLSAQGGGVIAHTNSLAGFVGLPQQGPYSAAKGALRLLIDTCRLEYASRGIRFVSLYPGFVATERIADDGVSKSDVISAEEAARQIIAAILAEKHDHLFPRWTALQIRVAMLVPGRIRDRVLSARVDPDPVG
jgi:NAD(P)-dependent dehydrogenase (short-subunit alcohol dehydrogenase family)